jgi:hypothetical protein
VIGYRTSFGSKSSIVDVFRVGWPLEWLVLLLKGSVSFPLVTKIFVMFDFMVSSIMILITVLIDLTIDLAILCLTTWSLN